MGLSKTTSIEAAVSVTVALIVTPSISRAADYEWVPLDRNPVLLSTAMPDELVCVYDEDDNGLDDEIETQIAQAFVPQFRFDGAEEHTRADEPHAVYSAIIALDDEGNRILTVRYMFVWHEDGGWVNDSLCGDAHAGDTQGLTATVELIEGYDRWYARLRKVSNFSGFNEFNDGAFPASFLDYEGSHPVVFPCAGKHHIYPYANKYTYHHTGPDCTENAYGNSFRRIPTVEHIPHGTYSNNLPPTAQNLCPSGHVCVDDPAGFLSTHPAYIECGADDEEPVTVPVTATYCTDYPRWKRDDGRRRWLNVCTLRRTARTLQHPSSAGSRDRRHAVDTCRRAKRKRSEPALALRPRHDRPEAAFVLRILRWQYVRLPSLLDQVHGPHSLAG